MLKEVESKNGSCGEPETAALSDCMACVSGSIPTSLYTKKQTDEPSAFLYGAGEGNIPLSRPPLAPRCGLRTLTAVFWVFAYDMVHPDSPPLRLYGLRLGFNSHFVIYKKNRRLSRLLFYMEQVKGISRYQGRLRRRVAGYAP